MKYVFHSADSRGKAEHGGWLKSNHSFSFANYYDPARMGFGTLRVINDDIIAPSAGFPTHPHNNMEIISVPITGSLRHIDTMGNEYVISEGEVQTMIAGSGVAHSEYNASDSKDANFLQIWVMPKEMNVTPNYSQKKFDIAERQNRWQLIVSPDGRDDSNQINQDAFFSLLDLSKGSDIDYELNRKGNGVYFFLIDGQLDIQGHQINMRDALGVIEADKIKLSAVNNSKVLAMEVPMS